MAWFGLLDRTMIPDFPIPDSGIPNSEFRMAYGNPGIPHHVLAVRGAAAAVKESFITGPRAGGSDTGCQIPIGGWDMG